MAEGLPKQNDQPKETINIADPEVQAEMQANTPFEKFELPKVEGLGFELLFIDTNYPPMVVSSFTGVLSDEILKGYDNKMIELVDIVASDWRYGKNSVNRLDQTKAIFIAADAREAMLSIVNIRHIIENQRYRVKDQRFIIDLLLNNSTGASILKSFARVAAGGNINLRVHRSIEELNNASTENVNSILAPNGQKVGSLDLFYKPEA